MNWTDHLVKVQILVPQLDLQRCLGGWHSAPGMMNCGAMRTAILALATVVSFDVGLAGGTGSPDPRHTPAVGVSSEYKDSVIFLVGPMLGDKAQPVEEFIEVKQKHELTSFGTGFVVHESGYILTNAQCHEK